MSRRKNKKNRNAASETAKRSLDVVMAEYKSICEKVGDLEFRIFIMEHDVEKFHLHLAQLNTEANLLVQSSNK